MPDIYGTLIKWAIILIGVGAIIGGSWYVVHRVVTSIEQKGYDRAEAIYKPQLEAAEALVKSLKQSLADALSVNVHNKQTIVEIEAKYATQAATLETLTKQKTAAEAALAKERANNAARLRDYDARIADLNVLVNEKVNPNENQCTASDAIITDALRVVRQPASIQ